MTTGLSSVIIAAYNSSARLVCAVESIRNQTVSDLEIIVVGDAVTDDSEERLRLLGDERIRWENLDVNWGEQSVPTNRGLELARGDRVFFLNQDDLYLSHHMERCLALIDEHRLDVVWSPYLVPPSGSRPGRTAPYLPAPVQGVSSRHPAYDPWTFVPASAAAWRREALHRLGGWKTAAEVTVSPSQDLLYRAWRSGMRMRSTPSPSVLVLWSGARKHSYTPRHDAADNLAWLDAVIDHPELIDREIAGSIIPSIAAGLRVGGSLGRATRTAAKRFLTLVCSPWEVHPATPVVWARFRRRGGFVNGIRALNDLAPKDFGGKRPRGHS